MWGSQRPPRPTPQHRPEPLLVAPPISAIIGQDAIRTEALIRPVDSLRTWFLSMNISTIIHHCCIGTRNLGRRAILCLLRTCLRLCCASGENATPDRGEPNNT